MPTDDARFSIVGDSNSAGIARVARSRGLRFLGGPIGNGRTLDGDFFEVVDGTLVLREPPPADPNVGDLFRSGLPILSTLGFNTQRIAQDLFHDYYRPHRLPTSAISDAVLRQFVSEYKTGPLAFHRAAIDHGCPVFVVHSPQRFPDTWFELALRLEAQYLRLLRGMGAEFVDVRPETTDESGRLRPEFFTERPNDKTHANDVWAGLVLDRFCELLETARSGAARA